MTMPIERVAGGANVAVAPRRITTRIITAGEYIVDESGQIAGQASVTYAKCFRVLDEDLWTNRDQFT